MDATAIADLAIVIADDPEPNGLVGHLASVTFSAINPIVVTFYMRVDSPDSEGLVLVGHYGLTPDEESLYTFVNLGFPLPAAEAVSRVLPFSSTMAELAERFPLLRIRPELAGPMCQITLPITIHGTTVGAVLVALGKPFTWQPTTWHTALAIQALLGMYVRSTDRLWSPLRPRNPQFAVTQGLTQRQVGILQLVGQGRSTSAIAARLGFSESTIKQDLRRAMMTLRASDRQQAVTRARDLGLVPLN
jgi:DNA-binding CsgD family transcriptional regulator